MCKDHNLCIIGRTKQKRGKGEHKIAVLLSFYGSIHTVVDRQLKHKSSLQEELAPVYVCIDQ